MAWFVPGTEHTRWLRWIWIPIVLPAFILAALAWRAVSSERALYHNEILAAHQKLAAQLAGHAGDLLAEEMETVGSRMQAWGASADSVWQDTSGIVVLGLRTDNGRESLLAGSTECREVPAKVVYPAGADSLETAQNELLAHLYTPCAAWTADTSYLPRMEADLQNDLTEASHWRPLLNDLWSRLRFQARETAIWRGDSAALRRFLNRDHRGMNSDRVGGYMAIVLHEPLVPRGISVLCLLDEERLARRSLTDRWDAGLEKPLSGSWGWRHAGQKWRILSGHPGEAKPLATAWVAQGHLDWQIGVWPETRQLQQAARGRTRQLAAVLIISLGILLVTAWTTSRALEAQRQLLAMKTDFVSNVTHELKTPLTSVLLYAELLESGKAPSRAAEFGGVIRREAARLSVLIEGILAVARQEAGMGRLELSQLDVHALAQELCHALEPQAARKRISLSLTGPSPLMMESDPGLCRSILQNLIENAIKYGRPDGRVDVDIHYRKNTVRLTVADDGPGIATEDQKKVFDRFFRGGNGLTRSISGTGLGLSIVKSAVRTLGGRIHLESSPGQGTRMTVTIPWNGISKNG